LAPFAAGASMNTSIGDPVDLSRWYGGYYYRTYRGAPYERSELWLAAMRAIADGIVRECDRPRTVLDVGCAYGLLVEALRAKGIEAFGLDHSPHAIAQVDESVRAYCWVGSVLEPIRERYDLIVCNEVIEHLPPGDADAAIERICAAADDVLFASTPDHFDDATHLNVRPVEYWAAAFARHGFLRDLDFDGSAFAPPWAARFRKRTAPTASVVSGYERRLWNVTRENVSMRSHTLEQAAKLATLEQALRDRPEVAGFERTIEEQKEHLDALMERISYMTDREGDMRRLLLDAHEQLLQRDRLLQGRVPIAEIERLRALVDERTAWAEDAVRELESARETNRQLQETVAARTAWAQAAVEETEQARRVVESLREELDARTAWAQRAVEEGEQARGRTAALEAVAHEHAATIAAMTGSRVWRAAAPLRRARQWVTRSR
jgi:SAM-dependent methyltransferase